MFEFLKYLVIHILIINRVSEFMHKNLQHLKKKKIMFAIFFCGLVANSFFTIRIVVEPIAPFIPFNFLINQNGESVPSIEHMTL